MITLTINKEKKQIPTMDELTVRQFIELSKDEINIVSYLSICLGITYKEAYNVKAKGLDRLLKRLGNLEDYANITPKKFIVHDRLIDVKDMQIETVGQRFMIEENARKLGNEELLCFVLSIGIVDDPMNIDEVNELKGQLLDLPYKNVLPNAFFLASRFLIGRRNVMNYLKMLRQLINMRLRESRLALTDWAHTLTSLKSKRFASY